MADAGFAPTKNELFGWLQNQHFCTVATIGANGEPNAAVVAFSQTEALELLIITDENTHKAQNIQRDPRVAVVVTNTEDRYTLQIDATAERLSWDQFEAYQQHHYEKLPFLPPLRGIEGQTPFVIRPLHAKFTDVTIRPWVITEVQV